METIITLYVCIGLAYGITHLWQKSKKSVPDDIEDRISNLVAQGIPRAMISFVLAIATLISLCLYAMFWPIMVISHIFNKS